MAEFNCQVPAPAQVVTTTRPKNLLMTPDPFLGLESPSPEEHFRQRHVVELYKEYGGGLRLKDMLRQTVAEELSRLGVDYEFVRTKGNNKARKSPRPNPKDGGGSSSKGESAGNGLKRTVEVQLAPVQGSTSTSTVTIPFVVKKTCDYIRQHIKQQGIFRISGVASRANGIMQRFANPEIEEHFAASDTVHDVAIVLKQYLRELELPLIPHNIQHVFIQCLELQPESVRVSALLLASCLVPEESIGTLSYILQFLAEVAEWREENLMTFENLSIIMGLNIMPIDPRKNDKDRNSKDIQRNERQVLDLHNKVIESLIKHADQIGQITEEVERRLDSLFTLRSSEDELENDGVGRRKKRRSGSLNSKSNRMLGFLKKVTSGKSGAETPITPMPSTPGGDSFSYTPIIMGSARKNEDAVFSLRKKRNIFDGVRKTKSGEFGTPNTLPSQLACPSPAVCLDPSPMKMDWKTTPNGNRLKNFVTPNLLRRRDKSTEDKNVFSAPNKPSKTRIRFGRSKIHKKQEVHPQDSEMLKSQQSSKSTISIHKLVASPGAVKSRTFQREISVSKIPRPGAEKPALPPKRANLSSSSMKLRDNTKSLFTGGKGTSEGEYVIISTEAGLDDPDVRNEAFLASSSSVSILTGDESSRLTRSEAQTTTDIDSGTPYSTDSSLLEPPPPMKLQLTPLIQEIDDLTRNAGELTLSTLRGRSTSSIRSTRSHGRTLPESPTELETTPLNADQVEQKFIRAMKESKIIQIKCESQNGKLQQRRLSVQDRGSKGTMSPSQRRIVASAGRRRSHEIGRVTPIITPTRFLSLRSPKQTPTRVDSPRGRPLKRSPMRCTLKRGRPNTARVGLARPSPVRNTSRSVTIPSKVEDLEKKPSPQPPPLPPRMDSNSSSVTPLRRMSSVQELVNKLEKNRKSQCKLGTLTTSPNLKSEVTTRVAAVDCIPPLIATTAVTTPTFYVTRSKSREELQLKTPQTPLLLSVPLQEVGDEMNWVSGHQFKFDRKDFHHLGKSSDRESIHFLKTLRAGKVPQTVEYFNKIGHNRSPARSLIPRYTGLQSQGSKLSLNSNCSSNTEANECITAITTPSRIARRMSSVDIDIRNRDRKEELLEQIKKENAAVKRSSTTVGSCGRIRQLRPIERPTATATTLFRTPSLKRPTTLELKSPSTRPISRAPSLRRPNPQTPRISEEDESLLLSVNRAIEHLLTPEDKKQNNKSGKEPSASKATTSPLKNSNIANSTLSRKESIQQKKSSPSFKPSPPLPGVNINTRRRNLAITRTASENGTKSTTPSTPRTTPKIKKSLTTRAYDLRIRSGSTPTCVGSPRRTRTRTPTTATHTQPQPFNNLNIKSCNVTSKSHAHNCPTITPRRRVPRMGNGAVSTTPAQPSSSNSDITAKSKLCTPLRATHIFTPFH